MDQFMPPDAAAAAIKIPRRAYQACVRCRQRKARCLIPDPPPGADPVCMRCKRERKECIFTAERSQKQSARHASQAEGEENQTSNVYATSRNGTTGGSTSQWGQRSQTLLGDDGSSSHLSGSTATGQSINPQQNDSPLSDLTDRVTRTVVSNQSEALNLLFEAAEVYHTSDSAARPAANDAESLDVNTDNNSVRTPGFNSSRLSKGWEWAYPAENVVQLLPEVIQAFSRLKFVKKRWLTAQEAATFVILFFRNMCPFTPVISDWYGNPDNFLNLIDTEPVLCTEKGIVNSARSLGTVEGFLLMAEWHARSLHLPPDIEAWDSEDDTPKDGPSSTTYRWLEGVVEPMKRSDRMSWSLIQSAASVGHELGLYDEEGDNDSISESTTAHQFNRQRRQRLRVVLYLYMNQLAFRIGFSALIPHTLLSLSQNALKQSPTSQLSDHWIESMSLWVDLSRLTRASHDLLFASKASTRELVKSGGYRRILDHFKPILENWWTKYTAATAAGPFREFLAVDFLYTKIYLYSLALQAAAERKMSQQANEVPNSVMSSIFDFYYEDYIFIQSVIVAAKDVLRIILGFADIGRLRYLPVRTYVRAISSCIFLLKALALGVPTDELNSSLELIDQSARVLRLHIVDDLHLAGIFASLLETYTQSFRERFVSILGVSRPSNSVASNTEGFPASEHAETAMPAVDPTSGDYGINQDWLAHPFDASIAPFGADFTQTFGVFDDELNFIWNENM
ncbi:transcriptional regulator family: Fungal Specific TF [Trichoderma harzianum]|nr:transcriptional regulator family: Fungal Specific TF [Trichoderma harzianum]